MLEVQNGLERKQQIVCYMNQHHPPTSCLGCWSSYIKISTGIIHAQTLHPHQGCRPYTMWFSTFYTSYLNIAEMLTAVITKTHCLALISDPAWLIQSDERNIFSISSFRNSVQGLIKQFLPYGGFGSTCYKR